MLNISGIRDQDKFEGSQELKVHPNHSSCSETTVFFKFAERKLKRTERTYFSCFLLFSKQKHKLKQALYSAFIQALINDVFGAFLSRITVCFWFLFLCVLDSLRVCTTSNVWKVRFTTDPSGHALPTDVLMEIRL